MSKFKITLQDYDGPNEVIIEAESLETNGNMVAFLNDGKLIKAYSLFFIVSVESVPN